MTTELCPHKATLFVISAPSGAGKTSLVKALIEELNDIKVSVSHTTRAKRPGETDGKDYHFIDDHVFLNMVHKDAFLEHASVFKFHYGTSKQWVSETLSKGTDVILEIDWQGAEQITQAINCVSIFILPPSIEALKQRLNNRSQDSADIISDRMSKAKNEIAHYDNAKYIIINDNFDTALAELSAIIKAERLRTDLQKNKLSALINQLLE